MGRAWVRLTTTSFSDGSVSHRHDFGTSRLSQLPDTGQVRSHNLGYVPDGALLSRAKSLPFSARTWQS